MENETNEDHTEYPVKKIVQKSIDLNYVEWFKIRWLNFFKEDDWWMSEKICLPACYDLIRKYELSQFRRKIRKNLKPELISFRIVGSELKLLVRWSQTEQAQFYYSSVIQLVDPKYLLEFYEKRSTIRQLDDEWSHFLRSREKSVQLLDSDKPSYIIAVARCGEEELCIVQWERNQNESTVFKLELMKKKYPSVLIEFYERHIVPKNDR